MLPACVDRPHLRRCGCRRPGRCSDCGTGAGGEGRAVEAALEGEATGRGDVVGAREVEGGRGAVAGRAIERAAGRSSVFGAVVSMVQVKLAGEVDVAGGVGGPTVKVWLPSASAGVALGAGAGRRRRRRRAGTRRSRRAVGVEGEARGCRCSWGSPGCVSIRVSGAVVSIVQVKLAGAASMLPAASVGAHLEGVAAVGEAGVGLRAGAGGEAAAVEAALEACAPASVAWKVKLAELVLLGSAG